MKDFPNKRPFEPWNDPMERNHPFKAWNNPMYRNDPFAPWNQPFGNKKDYDEYCRKKHIKE